MATSQSTADPSSTTSAPAAVAAAVPLPQTPAATSPSSPVPAPAPGSVPSPTAAEVEAKQGETVKEEEPQNALTKKFTDAEWKAVKELRNQIPEILAQAYPDKENAKSAPVKLWGVMIDPNGPVDARVSVVLVKFLRARNLNVADAQSMLVATLRWREEFKAEGTVNEKFPEDIFGELGHVYGRDKGNRPVTYNLYGANKDLKAVFGDVERFIRWRVALMEKGVALLDFENVDQMVQVHDYEGVSLSSRDANSKNAASEATSIFQNHYPELLHKKFFVNVPTLLTWIFWIFRPLVSAQTLAKMTVVGSGPQHIGKELLPIIGAKELPKRYGGESAAF